MKIFLIGLMGSGKSVLGKKISQALQFPFIDLDEEIEKQEGLTVAEIFTSKGEADFRTIEADVLRKKTKLTEFVMATGGGTPCFHDNMNYINQTGTSIFLDTPIDVILNRIGNKKELRPLLATVPNEQLEEKLKTLLRKRLLFYENADFTINGNLVTVPEVLQLLNTKK